MKQPGEIYVVDGDSPPAEDVLAKSKVALDDVVVELDPREEWAQIFHEGWRYMRDFYWDPGMGGLDWAAERDRYAALLPRLASRATAGPPGRADRRDEHLAHLRLRRDPACRCRPDDGPAGAIRPRGPPSRSRASTARPATRTLAAAPRRSGARRRVHRRDRSPPLDAADRSSASGRARGARVVLSVTPPSRDGRATSWSTPSIRRAPRLSTRTGCAAIATTGAEDGGRVGYATCRHVEGRLDRVQHLVLSAAGQGGPGGGRAVERRRRGVADAPRAAQAAAPELRPRPSGRGVDVPGPRPQRPLRGADERVRRIRRRHLPGRDPAREAGPGDRHALLGAAWSASA